MLDNTLHFNDQFGELSSQTVNVNFSDHPGDIIDNTIADYVSRNMDTDLELESSFEKLIGMGEIVDRLSIVNIKLFKLKDAQKMSQDERHLAWLAVQDVKLVEERARLKKCIDEKTLTIMTRVKSGDVAGGINDEVKTYG